MKSKGEKAQTKMPSPLKSRKNFRIIPTWGMRCALGVLGLSTLFAGIWGANTAWTRWSSSRAEGQLAKGYAAVAAETLESTRFRLTSTVRGCKLLIDAYYGSRRADRLEWASQACLEAGIEEAEVFIGLAASRELINRDAEALQILGQVVARFDKIPDIHYRMAQIYKRSKKDSEAATALLKATERAPENHQLAFEAVENLSGQRRWSEAKPLADRLKMVNTDNPEVKLIIARVLSNAGDKEGAATLTAQARQLMGTKPGELQAALTFTYGDVLGISERTPASGKPKF